MCLLATLATVGATPSAVSASAPRTTGELMELSVEELMDINVEQVYAASKYRQLTREAPSAVSIVDSDEIKKYGYRTLADILGSVRGIYLNYDRSYQSLGVRGFNRPSDYNSRTLLLIDGHRVNDNIYASAAVGTESIIDVDLIERVEVIHGPSSSLYGTSAFFGVVNVITRRGREIAGVEVSGEVGSFDTYKGRLTYGNEYPSGLEVVMSGTVYDSDGEGRLFYPEYDDPETNDGVAEDLDYDEFHSFFTRLSYDGFTLSGAYVSRDKGVPTGAFEVAFNHPDNRNTDDQAYIDLEYDHTFDGGLRLTSNVFYDRYHFVGHYPFDYAEEGDPPDIVLNGDRALGEYWGFETRASKIFAERHRVTIGAEFRDNFRQDQSNFDDEPREVYLDDERSSEVWGPYVQLDVSLPAGLSLSAGIRHDEYDSFGGTTNPRVALIYQAAEGTTLKALYAEAFRAPNAFESYYHDGDWTAKANPDLEPETIESAQLVLEQSLGRNMRAIVSAFRYEISDLISQEIDPADDLVVFRNINEVETAGVEVELDARYSNGLRGRASYSYQETEDVETGKTLSNSPKHLAKLNLIAPIHTDKIFCGLELQHSGEVETLERNKVDDFWLMNVTLFSEELLHGLELSASVYNLFDENYSTPASTEHLQDSIAQDGTTFRVKGTYSF